MKAKTKHEFSVLGIIKSALRNFPKKYLMNENYCECVFKLFDFDDVLKAVEMLARI